jgi:GntR family transcriptional regulator/MocR family aminotransferase
VSTGPLLALRLDRSAALGVQIEQQLRGLIRDRRLAFESELPSTRALAADLDVSRGVVVGAYAQLAAEGYITLRRGAPPLVAVRVERAREIVYDHDVPIAGARFNLRPDLPDLALFPRGEWLAACRASLHRAANFDLAYGEPFGAIRLRAELAPFLARTRGVTATPYRTGVAAGSSQALLVLASVLRARGAKRIAVEDPGHRWRTRVLESSGLDVVPVPVDADGLRVDALPDVAGVVVSPDHQFPTGVTMSPGRRRELVEWAIDGNRLVLEHDYDSHFRYDRSPAGALQSLAPEHVAYVGSASALLAPTVRLGWAVLPVELVVPFAERVFATSISTSRLSQFALAELIERGYLDRHLRKARAAYKKRRAALVEELARRLPDAKVGGAPAGIFVHVRLRRGEARLLARAREAGFVLDGAGEHARAKQPPGIVLGFAAEPEPSLRRAVRELAALR